MPKTAGRCSSFFRPWTQPARTAPSSTSCPASTRKDATLRRLRRPPRRNSTTSISGALTRPFRNAEKSASSTAHTTEVLVVRVHQGLLNAQQLPEELVSKNIWEERYEDINNFEQYLVRNGVIVMKFFLHLSKGEQKKRFLERLEMPEKNWKFSMADVKERSSWKDYQKAYEEMIQNTATKHAPWYVIPADNKWFTRLAVAGAIIHKLHSLDLQFPEVDEDKKKELAQVRKALLAGKE